MEVFVISRKKIGAHLLKCGNFVGGWVNPASGDIGGKVVFFDKQFIYQRVSATEIRAVLEGIASLERAYLKKVG